jgi:hypothetical protein
MALDTYTSIAGKVLLRCPMAGPLLARDWVSNAFRQIAERRPWSWLQKQGQFIIPALYNTGTVTTTQSSATVTGAGTAWTAALIGRQFRLTSTTPIYTIEAVDVGLQTLTLDLPWGAKNYVNMGYEIYGAYASPPSDFNYFITIWDPNFNWQLHQNISQRELNAWDAQRSNRGQAYLVAPRDYYTPVGETIALPRFEVWPHVTGQYVLPFLYVARATDLQDSGALLPRYVRGDIILEMALAEAALWPGPSVEKVNPYFNPKLATIHLQKAEMFLSELERQDEEINEQNIWYDSITRLPWAPLPMDANFWQRHAI